MKNKFTKDFLRIPAAMYRANHLGSRRAHSSAISERRRIILLNSSKLRVRWMSTRILTGAPMLATDVCHTFLSNIIS